MPICHLLQGPLTFVAVRAALDELGLESAANTPPLELPPSISRKLYEIIAITAMQFRGYIFKVNEPQARTLAATAQQLAYILSARHRALAWCQAGRSAAAAS